jgi:hypothetical protein
MRLSTEGVSSRYRNLLLSKGSQPFAQILQQLAEGGGEKLLEDPGSGCVCISTGSSTMHPGTSRLGNSLSQARTEGPAGRV